MLVINARSAAVSFCFVFSGVECVIACAFVAYLDSDVLSVYDAYLRVQRKFTLLDPFEDARSYLREGLLHLRKVQRVDLNETDAVFLSEVCSFLERNDPFVLQVVFVAHEEYLHVRITVGTHFFQPFA